MHETREDFEAVWLAPAPRIPRDCAVKVQQGQRWRQCRRRARYDVGGYLVCLWHGAELLAYGLPEEEGR